MVIYDYEGHYEFTHIMFHHDGEDLVANYNGKEYRISNEEVQNR